MDRDLKMTIPRELRSMISRMDIDPKNMVKENTLDRQSDYISRYFTANRSVSELAYQVYTLLHNENIQSNSEKLVPHSLAYNLNQPDFKQAYPKLEVFTRILMLESFAIYYAVKYDVEYRKYLDENDIKQVRETLKYILSIIGIDIRFTELTEQLHNLNVDLGYIQGQVPVIRSEVGW